MTTTTSNASLLDIIGEMDNVARIPALRGIVHSTMAKCIGAIRQHMRDRQRAERNENEPQVDLDTRNQFDEDERSIEQIAEAMGFDSKMPPLQQASLLHAAFDWADSDLRTLATSQWDYPLSLEQMLRYMAENAQKLDKFLIDALAKAAHTTPEAIEKMHELQSQREQEQLIEATPEIVLTFKGFGANGYETAVDELPKLVQHQLGIKVVESLNKARNQVLSRVMRTRRIADLASVPIIEDAAKKASGWVEQFERRYGDEIREAIDAGRNVRTLEDITA